MSYKSTELFATAVKAMLDKRAAEDERLATVEYDISSGKVLQCRGKSNTKPERYDDILAMFSANGLKISKMLNG
jgi:hypothetical protein